MAAWVLPRLASLTLDALHWEENRDGNDFSLTVARRSALTKRTVVHGSTYTQYQRNVVHQLAAATASITLAAQFLAVYWFCLMRRNFRRDLIFLLILGGLFKSVWFLIFSSVAFVKEDSIGTGTPFCLVGGYFLQSGISACGEFPWI